MLVAEHKKDVFIASMVYILSQFSFSNTLLHGFVYDILGLVISVSNGDFFYCTCYNKMRIIIIGIF